jgi:hypothetical protein
MRLFSTFSWAKNEVYVVFRKTEYKTGMPEQKTIEINTIA